jgi:hypothetical protein
MLSPLPQIRVAGLEFWSAMMLITFLPSFAIVQADSLIVLVHYSTILRELEHLDISLPKLCIISKERDEDVHADFVCQIAQYSAAEIGFLDEFLNDERTLYCQCGRAKKGRRAAEQGAFVQDHRVSGEGLLTVDGIVANMVVEASITKEKFLHFLKHQVVSSIAPHCHTIEPIILDAIDRTVSRTVKRSYHGQ